MAKLPADADVVLHAPTQNRDLPVIVLGSVNSDLYAGNLRSETGKEYPPG